MSRSEQQQLLDEITTTFKDLVGIRTKAERRLENASSSIEALLLSVRTLRNPEEYSSRFESPEATSERQPTSSPQPAPSSREPNDYGELERIHKLYEREIERLKKHYEEQLGKMKQYYEEKLKVSKRDAGVRLKDYENLSAPQMRRILAEQAKTIEYQENLIESLMSEEAAE
eukprot:CAMPEP_0204908882 /NCGR_PEP_ID=MMETSP1397-20131031/7744_1 /ASSEMBLY_ACC=CAM_ASM_000891 /TAXON_ID=49980 /ORGANISM="Climacostomum Climacostomum virens, Strain Stock W-24" /LENGTH=171 /DNA_ID=CAMNT_0052078565 /DNA_START=1787 /DNA_END=2302 /DNA_ORIENTATION=-